MDEQALITMALEGDMNAFNHLVLNYQTMVFNTAYRIMGDDQAADDATQEAFISMYQKLGTYRGGSFKAWLLRIVTNACYDELRRVKRHPNIPLEPETDDGELIESPTWIVDDSPLPPDVLDQSELEESIQHCINNLDGKFRMVVILVDVNGEDYETAASILKSPVGTIKSRLARARQKLQECLQGFWELLPEKFRLTYEDN